MEEIKIIDGDKRVRAFCTWWSSDRNWDKLKDKPMCELLDIWNKSHKPEWFIGEGEMDVIMRSWLYKK